ncbi:MAG: DNA-protecting protein DprA [Alphaproteobacteria bacterium]|nr:DNA-protecting protein DprA [Alphaproteobacteria bacterium]
MSELTRAERLDWLQLIRTEGIGPVSFFRLIERFGSAGAALERLPSLSRAAGRRAPIKLADRQLAEEELAATEEAGARLIAAVEPDYPKMLGAIADPPPLICAIGHVSLFEKPAVALIGARNASAAGRKIARQLAADLGQAGVVVVSGLARGVDGAAHVAALDTGTIAVVAGGVDVIYPPEHEELTRDIARAGLILSERPLHHQPTARDFPRRNRLISGLSRGVVVVEAAAKSGTLITARFALEQGRDVFAVPGSPLDPRCQGANRLIRDGATLVESAADILESLAGQNRGASEEKRAGFAGLGGPRGEPDPQALKALRAEVLEALSFTPLHRDEILREIDAPASLLADTLLDLVLAGEAEEHSGGRFARRAEEG